jgi:uncharacterized protein
VTDTLFDEKAPTFANYSPPAAIRWGLTDALIAFGLFLASLFASALVIVTLQLDIEDEAVVQWFSLGSALFTYGVIVAWLVFLSRRKGLRSLARDFGLAIRPIDIVIGIGIGIAAKVASVVITLIAVAATDHDPGQGNFVLPSEPLWIVVNGVIVTAIIAPVVEELWLRGLVLRSVRNAVLRFAGRTQPAPEAVQKRAIAAAILLSSFAFAALHMYQSTDLTLLIALGGSTFVVGILNALVAVATGRLGAGIIAHIVFNGSAIALAIAFA